MQTINASGPFTMTETSKPTPKQEARRERNAQIVAAFVEEKLDFDALAKRFKVSHTTLYRVIAPELRDEDAMELRRAIALKGEVAKHYGKYEVDWIAKLCKTQPRVIRASIVLCIQDGLIQGPFAKAA